MYRLQRITITAMLLGTPSIVGAFAADSTATSCDFSIHRTEGEGTDYYAAHGIQKSEGEGGAIYTAHDGLQKTEGASDHHLGSPRSAPVIASPQPAVQL